MGNPAAKRNSVAWTDQPSSSMSPLVSTVKVPIAEGRVPAKVVS